MTPFLVCDFILLCDSFTLAAFTVCQRPFVFSFDVATWLFWGLCCNVVLVVKK